MSIGYTLYCDKCRHLIDETDVSPAETRRTALREGSAARIGRRDLCQGCLGEMVKPTGDVRTWYFVDEVPAQ